MIICIVNLIIAGCRLNLSGELTSPTRLSDRTAWECQRCTFLNDKVSAPVCEMCTAPRYPPACCTRSQTEEDNDNIASADTPTEEALTVSDDDVTCLDMDDVKTTSVTTPPAMTVDRNGVGGKFQTYTNAHTNVTPTESVLDTDAGRITALSRETWPKVVGEFVVFGFSTRSGSNADVISPGDVVKIVRDAPPSMTAHRSKVIPC